MPNENDRFDDVAEQLKQTDPENTADDDASTPDANVSAPTETTSTDSATASTTDTTAESATGGDGSPEDPAFPFAVTEMHGFYVREETWKGVTQLEASVNAACSLFDVPDVTGREFQDACLQVIADHGDEVALQLLTERGVDADADRVEEVIDLLSEQD